MSISEPPNAISSVAPTQASSAGHAGDLGFELPPPARMTKTRAVVVTVVVLAGLGAAFAFGYLPRHGSQAALVTSSQAAEGVRPRVEFVLPKTVSSDRALNLPGSVQPLAEAVLYPRVSGYVQKFLVDIGDKVQEGQLLAEIATPELDQELDQAKAQKAQTVAALLQAKANRDLAKTNLVRVEKLTPEGVTSQQTFDEAKAKALVSDASVVVAEAAVNAQEANIRRLNQVKSFGRVVAPFAGTINIRNIERGALVTAGNGTPLYKIGATDPVRVFLQIPQDVAPSLRVGAAAKVTVREYADRAFEAKVTRVAGALDSVSRTMTTEVQVPNPKGDLIPGMYANVEMTLASPHTVLEIPATALLTDAKGVRVSIVGPDDRIHIVPVVVERDSGAAIFVSSGLTGTERVVRLASAELYEGREVDARAPEVRR